MKAITASAVRDGGIRGLSWTAAFGQKREVHGNLEAYLLEARFAQPRQHFYSRIEAVAKDILEAVPENLRKSYGAPLSFYLFLRYGAPVPGNGHVH